MTGEVLNLSITVNAGCKIIILSPGIYMPNKNKTDEYICEIQNENISVKYKIV